jgi:hypothetical protein
MQTTGSFRFKGLTDKIVQMGLVLRVRLIILPLLVSISISIINN